MSWIRVWSLKTRSELGCNTNSYFVVWFAATLVLLGRGFSATLKEKGEENSANVCVVPDSIFFFFSIHRKDYSTEKQKEWIDYSMMVH